MTTMMITAPREPRRSNRIAALAALLSAAALGCGKHLYASGTPNIPGRSSAVTPGGAGKRARRRNRHTLHPTP
ncbi:MAG: hypothetical protein WCI73_15565 [Phycisphaerae bacterium]